MRHLLSHTMDEVCRPHIVQPVRVREVRHNIATPGQTSAGCATKRNNHRPRSTTTGNTRIPQSHHQSTHGHARMSITAAGTHARSTRDGSKQRDRSVAGKETQWLQEHFGFGDEGGVVLHREGSVGGVRNEVEVHMRLLVEPQVRCERRERTYS